MKINYKTIVVVSSIINLLLLLFLIMITLSNRRYVIDRAPKQEYSDYDSDSPEQTNQLAKLEYQDYKRISDIISMNFPEIETEHSMSTLLIPDSNVHPFVLNEIEKRRVQSILKGLEEWEELPESGKMEITEVMKTEMISILDKHIRALSYKDVESDKESYQLFFQIVLDAAEINNEPRKAEKVERVELDEIVVEVNTLEDYNKLNELIDSLKAKSISNKESEQ